MPISLIKKNQLDPNIADLVGQYGSGFFIPIAFSGQVSGLIYNILDQISGVDQLNGLQKLVSITGDSGILVSTDSVSNSITVTYTGINVPSNLLYTTGNQTVSGSIDFVNNITVSGSPVLTAAKTGAFYAANNPSGFITTAQTGSFVTTAQTGNFYPKNNPSGFITGINLSSYTLNSNTGSFITNNSIFDGDLSGTYPSLTINKIQGNNISAQLPANGQILQWNGSAWVPGAVPAGGNGGGGVVYYFNFGNNSGIYTSSGLQNTGLTSISLLDNAYNVSSGSFTTPDLSPSGQDILVASFINASGEPGVLNISAGLWDFNIWAATNNTNTNQTAIRAVINIYNPDSLSYRFLAQSDEVYLYNNTSISQYQISTTVPQTDIAINESIYIQLFASKYTDSNTTVTLYFDNYRPSHVHTTLSSVAGNGVVKVVNGVYQSPATGIFDSDVDINAAIQQGKIQGLTSSLAELYPKTNPSGFITGVNLSAYTLNSNTGSFVTTAQTENFYPKTNPSGFITGVNLSAYTLNSNTGSFVTTAQTGNFYPKNNPSGYISGDSSINGIVSMSQSTYNSITPINGVLYIII